MKIIVRYLVGPLELKARYSQSADGPFVTLGYISGKLSTSINVTYVALRNETQRRVVALSTMESQYQSTYQLLHL